MTEKPRMTCKGCKKAISRREVMKFSEYLYSENEGKQIIPDIIRKYIKCKNCDVFPENIKFIVEWL